MSAHKLDPRQRVTTIDVLIIEDEQRYRDFLIDVLRDMDCRPTGVATAVDALQLVDDQPPDVVLLDLNLPKMDGMAFLERFRCSHGGTPVVIITGVGDLQSAQQAIRHGVTEFLTKPCHLGQIEQALDRCRRQLQRGAASSDDDQTQSIQPSMGASVRPIAELEREAILGALRACKGNRSAAAAELGISRRTLYNRIGQYRAEGVAIPGEAQR